MGKPNKIPLKDEFDQNLGKPYMILKTRSFRKWIKNQT